MNFRKNSKWPLTPPSFSENHVANLFGKDNKKSLFKGPHCRINFWNFSENSSDLSQPTFPSKEVYQRCTNLWGKEKDQRLGSSRLRIVQSSKMRRRFCSLLTNFTMPRNFLNGKSNICTFFLHYEESWFSNRYKATVILPSRPS